MTVTNVFFIGTLPRDNQNNVARNHILFTDEVRVYFPGEGLHIDITVPHKPVIHLEPTLRDEINDPLVDQFLGNIMAILAEGVVMLVALLVSRAVFRYTSKTALIHMVNETEMSSKKKLSLRRGLRPGYSRSAWRLFLIDVVIFLPLVLGFILLFFITILPSMLWISGNIAADLLGTLLTVGLMILYGLLVFAAAISHSPLFPLSEGHALWNGWVLQIRSVKASG